MWLDPLRKLFALYLRSNRRRRRVATQRRTPRLRLEHLEDRITPTAVVTTDLPDYAPGDTALIAASGFDAGETVELQVLHTDGTPNSGGGHAPWHVTDGYWSLDGVSEFDPYINEAGVEQLPDTDHTVDGNLGTTWYVNPDDSLNSTFELTTTGLQSGNTASTTFTDAIKTDYQHFQNIANSWANGASTATNSLFTEGESVPHSYLVEGLTEGVTYSFFIYYDYYLASKDEGGFLELATYNETVTGVPANPAGTGTSPVADADAFFESGGQIFTVNANVTAIGAPVDVGDGLQRHVSVTFTVNDGDGTAGETIDADFYWGLRLALPGDITPTSKGASDFSGASLQTSVDDLDKDGDGIAGTIGIDGGGNLSLNPNAIIAAPDLSITKTFADDTVTAGDPNSHTFTIVVTNAGNVALTNLVLDDVVDAGLTVTNVTDDLAAGTVSNTGNDIDGTLTSLGVGQSWTITVTYTVPETTDTGTITNTATIDSAELALISDDDTVDVTEDVELVVIKTFDDDTVDAGTTGHTFTITVTNNGTSDADNVVLDDVVSSDLTVTNVSEDLGGTVSNTGNDIDGSLATLAAGATWTITVTYSVPEGTNTGTINNLAEASSDEDSADDTDSVDVAEDVQLVVVKTFADDTVNAGTTGHTFTITVTNNGASDADNVVLDDVVDAALTVTNVSEDLGGTVSHTGNDIDGSLATLAAGATWTITVTYSVPEGTNTGTINNLAEASSDEDSADDTDSVDVAEDVQLVVVKTFADDTVNAGTTGHTFTITVTNNGTSDADNVVLDDVVDAALTVTNVSEDLGGTVSHTGNDIDGSLATLAAGATWTITVTYSVPEGTNTGTINNLAEASSDEDSADDTDSVGATEDVQLVVTKEFDDDTVDAGTTGHTFTITVTNNGTSDADNVVLDDVVDAGLTVTNVTEDLGGTVSHTGNDIDGSLATLAAGATWTITVTYSVPEGTNAQTIDNTAEATSDEDSDTGSDSVGVTEDVQLVVTKTFADSAVDAGTTGHSFTITVTNNGTSDADNVVLDDVVVAGLTVTNVSEDLGGTVSHVGNDIDGSLATLAAGATWTITVTYDVPEGTNAQTIDNTAEATSDEDSDTGSDSVIVTEDVQLVVVKTFADDTVDAGTTGHTFTITVTNNGTSDADNVVLDDVVDSRLTVTNVTEDLGGTVSHTGNDIDGSLATLAAGATWTITVTYDVPADTNADTIDNTAEARSDEDSDTGSDSLGAAEDVQLVVVKTFADNSVNAGTTGHTFTITVTNNGTSDADNVVLDDVVDAALTVTNVTADAGTVSHTGNDIDGTLATLAAGATWTITVTYDVPEGSDTGTVDNTAEATSDEDSDTGTDSVDVAEDVQLVVTKTFTDDEVASGDGFIHTFTITVKNNGTSDADNVVLDDVVGSPLVVVDVTANLGTVSHTGNDIDGTLGTLAAGATWIITVSYTVPAGVVGGTVTNTADAASDEDSAEGSDSVGVVAQEVSIVKSGPLTAPIGTIVTYRYEVRNLGPAGSPALTNIHLVDDNGTPGNTADDVQGKNKKTTSPYKIKFTGGDTNNNGRLDVGEVWKYAFKRKVLASDSNPLVNTVVVTANPFGFTRVLTDTTQFGVGLQEAPPVPLSKRDFII